MRGYSLLSISALKRKVQIIFSLVPTMYTHCTEYTLYYIPITCCSLGILLSVATRTPDPRVVTHLFKTQRKKEYSPSVDPRF